MNSQGHWRLQGSVESRGARISEPRFLLLLLLISLFLPLLFRFEVAVVVVASHFSEVSSVKLPSNLREPRS